MRSGKIASKFESAQRRREIERILANQGVALGPRPLGDTRFETRSKVCRLRSALISLGPYFSYFGLFLSSRPDLVQGQDCAELAKICGLFPALDADQFRQAIQQESPRLHQRIDQISSRPWHWAPHFEIRRAQLRDGSKVNIKILRLDFKASRQADQKQVGLLEKPFAAIWPDFTFEWLLADFYRYGWPDLSRQFEFLAERSAEAQFPGNLRMAVPSARYSTPRVLVFENWREASLVSDLSSEPASALADPIQLGRRICMAWLHQAFLGEWFPCWPALEGFAVQPEGQLTFSGGPTATIPRKSQDRLLNYLMMVVLDRPDEACLSLIEECQPSGECLPIEVLKRRFRQLVPFRDGGWNDQQNADSLAELLFVQWRLITASGYRPKSHLAAWYQGLFQTALMAHSLAPHRDLLRDAIFEFRLLAGASRFRELADPGKVVVQAEKYLTAMAELPDRMDAILNRLAAPAEKGRQTEVPPKPQQRSQLDLAVLALLIVLVSTGLMARHLAQAGAGSWLETASLAAFIFVGGLLLRQIVKA